jgi:PAS domain S-box-containing protein
MALGGIAVVTLVTEPVHSTFNDTTVSLALLLVVLFAATFWGKGPALAAAVAGMFCLNFFFLPPVHSITITDPENWVALAAFVITALTAGQLSLRVKRRAAEAEAERSEARRAGVYNRSLIEASLDPLVTIGPDGKIADVNAAAEKATGRSRLQLVGTDFSSYFTDPEKARAGYERAFHDGSVRDYALELQHPEGDTTSVLYNASVYRDEKGTPLGVLAAARDITERKRAEAEIRSLARLQAVVAKLGQKALQNGACGPVRDAAVALVAQTLELEYCQVLEMLPDGTTLLVRSAVGLDKALV